MSSKTKQLQKYLLHRVMLYEDNAAQWAIVDSFLGEEHMLRLKQVRAMKDNDTSKTVEIHNERIRCLEQALEELRRCPACGPHEEKPNEPSDPTSSNDPDPTPG